MTVAGGNVPAADGLHLSPDVRCELCVWSSAGGLLHRFGIKGLLYGAAASYYLESDVSLDPKKPTELSIRQPGSGGECTLSRFDLRKRQRLWTRTCAP